MKMNQFDTKMRNDTKQIFIYFNNAKSDKRQINIQSFSDFCQLSFQVNMKLQYTQVFLILNFIYGLNWLMLLIYFQLYNLFANFPNLYKYSFIYLFIFYKINISFIHLFILLAD
ncbi:transmembrane protein, putative (macronuclear) [Tetrahymena thermophila SB210]|uniref:Transmembrane protein, putative n=1 Tax=Tetrahymena thermophila (strain SB210) TaxID=312017 RepID=W7X4S6_TETTS|nr:transmembrane protein, putative [Tetrahymena thermophila SB210]EWS71368.1 transmembrane protein, putative [Tetrahymena thermophila SB210]|eukprot:XP_012656101.1 transmembrane protein, putative [Tetrahymena thermophila SB210]